LPGEMLLLALLLSPRGEAGQIIGAMRPSLTLTPTWRFLSTMLQRKVSSVGGLLVHEDFMLTAAHCWGSSTNITLRDHNIYQQERTQQVFPVRRAIPHPGYDHNKWVNAIMLLQLRRKAYLTAAVSPIRLPWRRELVKPGMVCSVAGWGHLGVNNPMAEKLQAVDLEVQRDEECISHYKDYNTTTPICREPKKEEGFFFGEIPSGVSGGPLVCNGMAQGIVSFGEENGTPPNVYTRVSSFLYWIQKTMSYYKLQGPD
uniref:Peptidase S1 domain-containing protein n=1 Tax=Monodon monoceros TaxID=40151 RepID=A0A8C6C0H8_MONMO